jgi:hypothetical protein
MGRMMFGRAAGLLRHPVFMGPGQPLRGFRDDSERGGLIRANPWNPWFPFFRVFRVFRGSSPHPFCVVSGRPRMRLEMMLFWIS